MADENAQQEQQAQSVADNTDAAAQGGVKVHPAFFDAVNAYLAVSDEQSRKFGVGIGHMPGPLPVRTVERWHGRARRCSPRASAVRSRPRTSPSGAASPAKRCRSGVRSSQATRVANSGTSGRAGSRSRWKKIQPSNDRLL